MMNRNKKHTPRHIERPSTFEHKGGKREHKTFPRKPSFQKLPEGQYWLYGMHAAEAALLNPHRRIVDILLTEEAQQTLSARITSIQPHFHWPESTTLVDREYISHVCGPEAVHQGIALHVHSLNQPAVEDLSFNSSPLVILDQITDPRNIGAILRSAAAFGVKALIVQDRHAPGENAVLAKAASGALEKVSMISVVNLSRTIQYLKTKDVWVMGMEANTTSLDGASYENRKTAIVLGAEGNGLRRLVRENCDELVGLRMAGEMESLNVSNAAAIALYELTRTLSFS